MGGGVIARFADVVVAALIGRPLVLPDDLLARWPELPGARWRRGGLPPRIGGWCLGASSVSAITLWRWVFVAERAPLSAELLLHELRHVHQFQAGPLFPVRYVWQSARHGYHRNRFEADARDFAARRLRGQP